MCDSKFARKEYLDIHHLKVHSGNNNEIHSGTSILKHCLLNVPQEDLLELIKVSVTFQIQGLFVPDEEKEETPKSKRKRCLSPKKKCDINSSPKSDVSNN